jgi:hypothetical protein
VTTNGTKYALPRVGNVEGEGVYLMPGSPGGVARGFFVDNQPVSIDKVLSGASTLESDFAVEYDAPGVLWGIRTRHYRARLLLEHRGNPPSFAQLVANGD